MSQKRNTQFGNWPNMKEKDKDRMIDRENWPETWVSTYEAETKFELNRPSTATSLDNNLLWLSKPTTTLLLYPGLGPAINIYRRSYTCKKTKKNILKGIATWKKNKSQEEIGESLETIQLYSKTHWDLPFPMAFKCDISLGCQRFGEKEI